MNQISLSLEERKVIYRARRGLMELDFYFDKYIKIYYFDACEDEKKLFASLVAQEDPDLLDWFMEVRPAPNQELQKLIEKIKAYVH